MADTKTEIANEGRFVWAKLSGKCYRKNIFFSETNIKKPQSIIKYHIQGWSTIKLDFRHFEMYSVFLCIVNGDKAHMYQKIFSDPKMFLFRIF